MLCRIDRPVNEPSAVVAASLAIKRDSTNATAATPPITQSDALSGKPSDTIITTIRMLPALPKCEGRVKLLVFVLMGLMCAFAGIITTARSAAGSPSAGVGGELDAISACFIGGTSMRGGSGTVYGALIGALVMASLDNGMQQMNVDASWQMIVKGVVLVVAVLIDVLSGSNRG